MEAQESSKSGVSNLSNLAKFMTAQKSGNVQALVPETPPAEPAPKPEEPKPTEPVQAQEPKPAEAPPVKEPSATEPKPNEPIQSEKPVEGSEAKPIEPQQPEHKPLEITDDAVLEYLKSKKGKELNSLEDLFKEPEPQADPYEGLPEEAVNYIKYAKETGRGFNDFQKLNTDYTKLTPLQIAQQKAIDFSDGELTMADVNEYLEKELGIDLQSPSELDKFDAIKLKGYGRDYLQRQMADQEKYKQPLEKAPKADGPKMLTLENGAQISEEAYKNLQIKHNQYLENVKKAADSITSSSFQVKIDDNGNEKLLDLSYDLSKDDKHKMVSLASDTNNALLKLFGTEKGELDHAKLQMGFLWADDSFREKAINSLVHKALAQQAEEFTKLKNNVNFSTSQMPKNTNGMKTVPVPGVRQNHGVKFSLEQFKQN